MYALRYSKRENRHIGIQLIKIFGVNKKKRNVKHDV